MRNYKHWSARALAAVLAVGMIAPSFGNVTPSQAASKKAVKSISLSKPAVSTLALKKGEKFSLKVTVAPKGMSGSLAYHSSKKAIVAVNKKGVLKAKKPGTSVITVSSRTKPKKKQKLTVTVYKKFQKVKKVSLNQKSAELAVGGTLSLKASVTPGKATEKGVVYVSSKTSVATVNKKGVVTAEKTGKAKITAYAKDGRGAKASCQITVVEASAEASAAAGTSATPAPSAAASSDVSAQPTPPLILEPFTIAQKESAVPLYLDKKGADYAGLSLIADSFAGDVALVSSGNATPKVSTETGELGDYAIIFGSIGNNDVIDSLIAAGTLDVSNVTGKRETYRLQIVDNPVAGVKRAVVVAGSDKRGAIYGLYHISELMGVSPWVYWGDAVPDKKESIVLDGADLNVTSKEPSVRYRGIFLNDEAPSLSSWVRNTFEGYNENFYAHVFELILRCKGNYLWPAMWSNDFSSDGKSEPIANAKLADTYGVVMGTSHHEPMCRAGIEWQRDYKQYGEKSVWDFNQNEEAITQFWRDGIARNKNFENVYTIGMRGESDSALAGSKEQNINLLKKVITTQKQILADNNMTDVPKVLTVYKEVEDFWHGTEKADGLKKWDGLDDVIIMLCDDNFGNMRTLPTDETINRAGGWGMYYHYDYHGGPTSYEWVNTSQLNKTWEQMSLAYEHGIDDIWIVNVGDLKPMEMNISYFLDMAYDYDTWGKNGRNKTDEYVTNWVKQQFGSSLNEEQVKEVKSLLDDYTWLNGSCKPESLTSTTYNSSNYNEAQEMLGRIERMMKKAEECKSFIPEALQAAYFELVYFPTVASANVAKMQICSGLNKYYAGLKSASANLYGAVTQECIELDKKLQDTYNKDMPGVGDKWNGMMSSPHVGFVTWNSDGWSYPSISWVKGSESSGMMVTLQNQSEAYTNGQCTLSDFTNVGDETYTISVSNAGGTPFNYTVEAPDWIKVSKQKGYVKMQDVFEVSVDWSKVTGDKSGAVTIAEGDDKVTVNVSAKVYDVSNLQEKTYLYANGYASILPGNYVKTGEGKNGTQIDTIKNYGKTGEMMKAFPTNAVVSAAAEDAAYADYLVWVPKAGSYKLTAYTGPSNNIDRDSVSINFGLSVNGEAATVVNTLDSKSFAAGEYSGSWAGDVKNNGRTKESSITLKEGVNTIRIYAIDPTFLLQKLVVSEKSVQASHLGPQESYYIGKAKTEKTIVAPPVDSYSIPGEIDAFGYSGSNENSGTLKAKAGETYVYAGLVVSADTYHFGIRAKSANSATAKVLWRENGKSEDVEIGTLTFREKERLYTIGEGRRLPLGAGRISLVMESGEAEISNISVKVKEKVTIPGSFNAASYEGSDDVAAEVLEAKTGENYTYYGSVSEAETYQFAIRGKSSNGAVVKMLWNDQEMGAVTLDKAQKKMVFPTPLKLSTGSGMIRMILESGTAEISSVQAEVYDEEGVKPLTIDSCASAEGYGAECAYDGDKLTSWKPNDSEAEKWISFDFGAVYYFDRFALTQTGKGITEYELQMEEGGSWKTLYKGTEIKNGADIFFQGREAVKAQKLRLVFTGTGIEIPEIKVTPYINWAMQDKVTITGLTRNGAEIPIPNGLVDGDRITKALEDETGGTSTEKKRHSVTMEFSGEKKIDTVRLITLQESESNEAGTGVIPNLNMTSEKAQYSYKFSYYDGEKWKEIGSTERPEAGTNPKVFSEFKLNRKVKTTAIKVEIYTSHWIRINELEAAETVKFQL